MSKMKKKKCIQSLCIYLYFSKQTRDVVPQVMNHIWRISSFRRNFHFHTLHIYKQSSTTPWPFISRSKLTPHGWIKALFLPFLPTGARLFPATSADPKQRNTRVKKQVLCNFVLIPFDIVPAYYYLLMVLRKRNHKLTLADINAILFDIPSCVMLWQIDLVHWQSRCV